MALGLGVRGDESVDDRLSMDRLESWESWRRIELLFFFSCSTPGTVRKLIKKEWLGMGNRFNFSNRLKQWGKRRRHFFSGGDDVISKFRHEHVLSVRKLLTLYVVEYVSYRTFLAKNHGCIGSRIGGFPRNQEFEYLKLKYIISKFLVLIPKTKRVYEKIDWNISVI